MTEPTFGSLIVAALKSATVTPRKCGCHCAEVAWTSLGKFANAHRLFGELAVEMTRTCSPTAALTAAAETNSHAPFGAEADAGGGPAPITSTSAAPTITILRLGKPIFQLLDFLDRALRRAPIRFGRRPVSSPQPQSGSDPDRARGRRTRALR